MPDYPDIAATSETWQSADAVWRDGQGYPYPRLSVTGLTYGSLPATLTANSAYAAPPYILMTRA